MTKTTMEEYLEASKGLKFIPVLERCDCGEQVNITNEWVVIEPLPEGQAGTEIDRKMICRCKKCGTLFLTEYNFAKTRWSIFGMQYFYLCDLDSKKREEVAGRRSKDLAAT
jgi:hypothetical protein